MAGSMPRADYLIGENFDEQAFAEVWERWLATLLSQEVATDEQKWLNYFFEESQVKIDITDMILEDLIHEICIIVNSVEENSQKPLTSESIFKMIPHEMLELLRSWEVDPSKPPENTLFT